MADAVVWTEYLMKQKGKHMIYSEMIRQAMNLAYTAHEGQLDKSGYPYIAHPLHLAESMSDEASTIVALLHDVVEDTEVTFEEFENMGLGADIIAALKLLTHGKDIPYMSYINELKCNSLARKVKIADLKHNSDLTRLDTVTEKDIKRVEKYKEALIILENI